MRSDAYVRVTCDRCQTEAVEVELEFFPGHGYEADDRKISRRIERDEEWKVVDGKDYCGTCVELMEGER